MRTQRRGKSAGSASGEASATEAAEETATIWVNWAPTISAPPSRPSSTTPTPESRRLPGWNWSTEGEMCSLFENGK